MKTQKPYVLKPGDVIRGDRNAPGGIVLVKKATAIESALVRLREWWRRLTY